MNKQILLILTFVVLALTQCADDQFANGDDCPFCRDYVPF